jgi:hypothetical protein
MNPLRIPLNLMIEVEAIRPLFKQYGIEDCLSIVNAYVIDDIKNRDYDNKCEYKYQINGCYTLINISYFGIWFHPYIKDMMLQEFLRYLKRKIKKNYIRHEKNKILKNNALNQYCFFKMTQQSFNHMFEGKVRYFSVEITFIKHYYHHYKSVYGSYMHHCAKKYGISYKQCQNDKHIRQKYNNKLESKYFKQITYDMLAI